MTQDSTSEEKPWFAGKTGTIIFFRINRRPLENPSLNAEQPGSVMDHLIEALIFGETVITGKGNQREWILGNREILDREETLIGQIGWRREGSETQDEYDPESKQWLDVTRDKEASARTVFCFDAKSRILGVLKHSSFNEKIIPYVFEDILKKGENRRTWPSTEWAVEPILDPKKFSQWLREVDVVRKVELVAKLPNPDGLEAFGSLWRDMDEMEARKINYGLEAAGEQGLLRLEQNERVKNHIAMSERAYGYVTAKGKKDGRKTTYDQRKNVERATVEEMPPLWSQIKNVVKSHVKARGERFLRDNLRVDNV